MEFSITGIEAQAKKNFESFKTLRPVGVVTLKHEPDNLYDPFCIGVWYDGILLGYIPALKENGEYVGSELQRKILEDGITTAKIAGYGYLDGKTDWNDEHRGRLGSVRLNIGEIEESFSPSIGGNYIRVTDFIGYLNPYGKSDGLIRWAYSQGNTFEDYEKALNLTAEAGTAMHTAIESDLRGEPSDGLPDGWIKFREKYELDTIRMEERFFDSTLMVTGQPDWVGICNGKLMVLDWKSGKKPSLKHKLQLAIYAKNTQFDGKECEGAMVVCFGSDNKQGFATASMTKDQIETTYEAMKWLRKVVDAVAYVSKDKIERV
jgi:hypothetical protein